MQSVDGGRISKLAVGRWPSLLLLCANLSIGKPEQLVYNSIALSEGRHPSVKVTDGLRAFFSERKAHSSVIRLAPLAGRPEVEVVPRR